MKGLIVVILSLLMAGCGSLAARKSRQKPAVNKQGKVTAAETRHLEEVSKAHALYASAVLMELNAEPEAAMEAYFNAALGDLEDETLVLTVSARLLQAKQPDRALELLKKAAARPGATGAIFARLGFVYTQQGKTDLAIAANREAIDKAPASLAGYQNLFFEYLQGKQPDAALQLLKQAQKKAGNDPEFLMGLSEYFATLGLQFPTQREEANTNAMALLKRVDALHPAEPMLRLKLADGFNLLGNTSRAAELYLDLLKKLPEIPVVRERVHAKLAEIYLHRSDHKAAAEQLQAILKEDPSNPQIYYYLGSIAFEDKHPEEAVDHFRKAIILNPNFEPAYYEMASALISLNRTGEALAALEQAGQKFPQNFVREYLLAIAFRQEKAYPEALQHFTAAEVIARATDPKRLTDTFFFQIGATHERKGDLGQAEKYFRQSLELSPDNAEVLNYLGYMWAEHATNLVTAREMIEKALKSDPENEAYLDSMAWVLFQMKQPQEALPYVEKSVKLSEQPDAVLLDHLGDIQAALEHWEQACDAWRKSLLVEPNDSIRKKLEEHEPKLK